MVEELNYRGENKEVKEERAMVEELWKEGREGNLRHDRWKE